MTDALRAHLVSSRLAGSVATTVRSTLDNCAALVAGAERYTFGLDDWRDASFADALAAVVALCGGDPTAESYLDGPGTIDPDRTAAAIALHRDRLAAFSATGGSVLFATGHVGGLQPHYSAIGRALTAAGCRVLTPLDGEEFGTDPAADPPLAAPRRLRFRDGVAGVHDQGGRPLHTHRPRYMVAMLDALAAPPDLVVADHGMAGAAIARGIPTLSIADVNDPALPLAQARRRTDGVLCIDDNLPPRLFVPVTEAMLDWTDR